MEAQTQNSGRQEGEPGRKYGCREYSLEMQLYQLNKKILQQDLKEDERNRIVKRIAEIEEILDF
ncbi:MAG: hypothetical protein DRH04_08560 [Deltaproteobacteria bacterium]|nr:MAG: hypothetical protein DRH04_08560 [Deltaproteobacteria bacterium]